MKSTIAKSIWFVWILLQCSVQVNSETSNFIVNGAIARKGEKFAVQLLENREFLCTGTLINPEAVLTARHCFDNKTNYANFAIRYGTKYLKTSPYADIVVKRVIPGPKPENSNIDIALLILSTPIKATNIDFKQVFSTVPELNQGSELTFYGWGRTSAHEEFSDQLLEGTGYVLSEQKCREATDYAPDALCLISQTHQTCTGDSGGPVLFNNQLVGIISYSNGLTRCTIHDPLVLTKVSYYHDWIADNTKP